MRIFYLSTTSFSDCELALLNKIGETDTVKYGVVIPRKNNNFTEDEIRLHADKDAMSLLPVHLKYRFRDARQVLIYLKLLRNIRSFKPDVIYINFFHDVYFNSLIIPFLNSKKTILGLHDVLHHSGTKNKSLVNLVQNAVLSKFKNVLTFSKSQMQLLKAEHDGHRVFNIPLMLKDFGEKKTKMNEYSTIKFLFFGNIQTYKGLDILLKAVTKLRDKYSNFSLTIAGRCKEWDTLYQPLINDKVDIDLHIRFIKNEEIPEFFSQAHYLLLPYKDVTQSGPLMIAYNYDLPVISSNIDGFREFIEDGKTGFLFENMNVDALKDVLEQAVLRKETDYNKLIDGIKLYKDVHFAPQKIKNDYLSMFQEVIDVHQKN